MIETIQQEWAVDCEIDQTRLSDEVARTPRLHSKYLNYLLAAKSKHAKAKVDLLNLRRVKKLYYNGQLDRSSLVEYGWTQYQGPKLLKTSLEEVLSEDSDIIEVQSRVEYWMFVMDAVEKIMKAIGSRTYDTRALIDYQRFLAGQ